MDSGEASSDYDVWYNWSDTHDYNNWNSTYVYDDEEPDGRIHVSRDPWAVYKNLIIAFSFLGLAANVALLALLIARVYQYRATDKWKWPRLHLLAGLSVVHILLVVFSLVGKFPQGLRWASQSDVTCQFMMTVLQALQLLAWLYLLILALTVFLHVYHPPALLGPRALLVSLLTHGLLWTAAFVSIAVAFVPYTRSWTHSAHHGGGRRFCTVDDPEMRGILLLTITLLLSFVALVYLAFVSLVGTCLVNPTTDTTGQDNGMLQWSVKSQVKAGLFLALVTGLFGATCFPGAVDFMIRFVLGNVFTSRTAAEIRRYHTIQVVQQAYLPLFPLCCLVLQEMGVYALINRIRK